jgi:hypothetical protein
MLEQDAPETGLWRKGETEAPDKAEASKHSMGAWIRFNCNFAARI